MEIKKYLPLLIASIVLAACGGNKTKQVAQDSALLSPPALTTSVTNTQSFPGLRAAYSIKNTTSGFIVTENITAKTTPIATNITSLSFSDSTVNLTIAEKIKTTTEKNVKQILELYVAFFNRVPDADGLAYWIEQVASGTSIITIAENFYGAALQYSSVTGYTTSMTNADFIKIVYKNVLGRSSVDESGMTYWSASLATGKETRGSLVATIINSAHTFKGDATYGYVADLLDNKLIVSNYFAVTQGLNYNTPNESITKGMEIAAAVTATDTTLAKSLIKVGTDGTNDIFTPVPDGQNGGNTNNQGINLLAGSVVSSNIHAPGWTAALEGIAIDAANNIYFVENFRYIVRKMDSSGVVTTLAGTPGVAGSADGEGAAASFNLIAAITLDGLGNLYVADKINHTIRKITSQGAVTTVAGKIGSGFHADGVGVAASFTRVQGLAADSAGNLFVADGSVVRKVTVAGVVTTIAGDFKSYGSKDATGIEARFFDLTGIAVDVAGNIYVTDSGNNNIRKITPNSIVTTLAGTAGTYGVADGVGASAKFNRPTAISVDKIGSVYVADIGDFSVRRHNIIRKITSTGIVTTLAGANTKFGTANGLGATASFQEVVGLATDHAGSLYAIDSYANNIRKIDTKGDVTTVTGTVEAYGLNDGNGASSLFSGIKGVASDGAGNIYVADSRNNVVRKISASGIVTTLAGTKGVYGSADGSGAAASFNAISGVAADDAGNVYVADTYNFIVRKISPTGFVTTLAGTARTFGSQDGIGAAASFGSVEGIASDRSGNVYVIDKPSRSIRKISSTGVVTTLAGDTSSRMTFNNPTGIAADGAGNVYVTDVDKNVVYKITSTGNVTVLAGNTGVYGAADGVGSAASFNKPEGICVDKAGNVYVADTINQTVRKITPSGNVTTVAGKVGTSGITLGNLPGTLSYPKVLTVDDNGILYVVSGGAVLKVQL